MIKYALQLIFRRKLRTFLTSIGITIAIVLLGFIIFGMQGLQNLLVNEFNSRFNPNQLIVSRYGMNFFSQMNQDEKEDGKKKEKAVLNDKVVSELKQLPEVQSVEAMLMISGMQLRLSGKEDALEQAFISGWDADKYNPYFVSVDSIKDKPLKGEVFVSKGFVDFYNLTNEQVIGKSLIVETSLDSFFTTKSKSTFNKSYKFKITGVFDPGQDRNDALLSTSEALRVLVDVGGFDNKKEYLNEIGYDQLFITVDENKLDDFKVFFKDKYGYSPLSSDEILSFLGNITDGLTVALILFALVSSVVAAIGIINTMIMSIYEQTKEIGIIKAIGASNFQVLVIFIIQSAMIGLIGGIMGLSIIYFGLTYGDPYVVAELTKAGFTAKQFFVIDPNISLYIVLGSVVVGIFSGIYPAIRAARLDPVKALRYE